MKNVEDFVIDDMWGNVTMSTPDVVGYMKGERFPTPEDKYGYCQGIFTVYPYMLLGNFVQWFWGEEVPKDYDVFMKLGIQALQSKVLPVLEPCFTSDMTEKARGEVIIPLLTDVIPKHVLTGFYDYMFVRQKGYKDISGFWPQVESLLRLVARGLMAAYDPAVGMEVEEKAELFLFVGTQMPYFLLKRWYDWQFGEAEEPFVVSPL